MSRPVILLMLLLWGEPSWMANYCVDQPREVEVFVGETATLPCTFVYPERKETVSDVTVIWKAQNEPFCGKTKRNEISFTNSSFRENVGKFLLDGDPRTQNVSLRINTVALDDTNRYCCRVVISFKDKKKVEFQSIEGTSLTVREENEVKLEQPTFIAAYAEDSVTFLCRFSVMKSTKPTFITCLLWSSKGDDPNCNQLVHTGDCSDVRGNVLSLQMISSKSSLSLLEGWYCWEVLALRVKRSKKAFGTKLVIVERTNTLKIFQPQEIVFRKNVIIFCKFTMPPFSDIIRKEVYWMTGDHRNIVVYHPNPDYIHPLYIGKTKLVDGSNLLLEDFQEGNDTMFYCRVMIQRCGSFNVTKTAIIMEEGPGTLLRIYDVNGPSDEVTTLPLCPQSILIAASAVFKFILLIALVILGLLYIRKNR